MGNRTEEALPQLIAAVREQDSEARAGVLGPSFLLRRSDGGVEDAELLGGGFERLCGALAEGETTALGNDYALVSANGDGEAVWLVHLADSRIGAAFEFERRADAIEAMPPAVRDHSGVEIVREAILAFVKPDVGKLMSLLASDFSYTDSVRGTTLNGASEVVNGLLLTFSDLPQRGIAGLELTELTNEMVRAEGILTRSLGEDPEMKWRWRTITGVVDGRIRWTVREPDVRVE